MKFIIVSSEYNENGGGVIALHKLCHILNEIGHEAFVTPFRTERSFGLVNSYKKIKEIIKCIFFIYKTNDKFNTPIKRFVFPWERNEFIVIYPENVSGNPLKIKKVVRWFLHHPGYFSKIVNYGVGEIYFSYGSFGNNFNINGSLTSNHQLKITHFFDEYYNMLDVADERIGTAYCMRKGKGRELVHDTTNSICIDGLTHEETARILKKVKTFISYDLYTAYSWFAVLCGCESIVVPEDNLSIEQWHPDITNRVGICYGFDEIGQETIDKNIAQKAILGLSENSYNNARVFIKQICDFFGE